MAPPKITVHWLNHSRSQRILWLLEELGLEYDIKTYERNPKDNLAPPELKEIHPLGKSPVLSIQESGASEPLVLAESGAIVEFLLERYGNGKMSVPATAADYKLRSQYLYWLHWAEGSAMLPLMVHIISCQIPKQGPFLARPLTMAVGAGIQANFVKPRIAEAFGFVNDELAGKEFFVGNELTGADIMMMFPCEGLEAGQGNLDKYPNIEKWIRKMQARPAYKRAEQKGGANDLTVFTK